jgi:hypothetical protein
MITSTGCEEDEQARQDFDDLQSEGAYLQMREKENVVTTSTTDSNNILLTVLSSTVVLAVTTHTHTHTQTHTRDFSCLLERRRPLIISMRS